VRYFALAVALRVRLLLVSARRRFGMRFEAVDGRRATVTTLERSFWRLATSLSVGLEAVSFAVGGWKAYGTRHGLRGRPAVRKRTCDDCELYLETKIPSKN